MSEPSTETAPEGPETYDLEIGTAPADLLYTVTDEELDMIEEEDLIYVDATPDQKAFLEERFAPGGNPDIGAHHPRLSEMSPDEYFAYLTSLTNAIRVSDAKDAKAKEATP